MRNERGIYVLLTAILIVALLALAAFLVGIGFKAGNRVILKDNANLVALAAIEGFIAEDDPNYSVKADAGLARANYILNRNSLKGINQPVPNDNSSGLGQLSHATGSGMTGAGEIEFGNWYEESRTGFDPCGLGNPALYPCFVKNPEPGSASAGTTANAVRVKLQNQPSNPIIVPIAGFLGTIEEQSYAIMVPRCVGNVIDLSYSAVQLSHRALPPEYALAAAPESATLEFKVTTPEMPFTGGLFAYPTDAAVSLGRPLQPSECLNMSAAYDAPSLEKFHSRLFWCNMLEIRNNVSRVQHFRSDYELEQTKAGNFWIDKYADPEPFASFLNGMNASLRLIKRTTTPGDKSMLMGFSGTVRTTVPQTGLSNDLDYLIQITNINNRGVKTWDSGGYSADTGKPRLYPNFLNEGFIPIYSADKNRSGTNLIAAITSAVDAISSETPGVNSCDAIGQKSIIIATDGIATCRAEPGSLTDYNCEEPGLDTYLAQEETLLTTVKDLLLEREISLTVLIDGAVGPHFINIYDPNVSPGNGSDFLTMEEARFLKFGVGGNPAFFNNTPVCPVSSGCTDDRAFEAVAAGEPGYEFRRPLATLGDLAFETGGLICPLLPQCTAVDCPGCGGSCYTDSPPPGEVYPVLKDCARGGHGSEQRCSYYKAGKSEQAAICATKAVGGNPYALREPTTIQ